MAAAESFQPQYEYEPTEFVEKPINREPPLRELVSSPITTTGGYHRNHSAFPLIDASLHLVQVAGEVKLPLTLTVRQLQEEFPQHEVTCALLCAGNRRHTMRTKLKEVHGVDWKDGAVMNCTWKGPRLRDVLTKAGVKSEYAAGAPLHVEFTCFQAPCEDDATYAVSIELWRAMQQDKEVLLALEMNGKTLTTDYGFPVRVVIPGVIGARWVKWLDRITVRTSESTGFYQFHDYKVLPPEVLTWEMAEKYWGKLPAMQEVPVNSTVAIPEDGGTIARGTDGCIEVRGYAIPQGDQGPVMRVEVSGDEGKTWMNAQLYGFSPEPRFKWSWVLWTARIKIDQGKNKTVYSRATDAGGNTQPMWSQWNLRGVGYNGYGASWNVTVL